MIISKENILSVSVSSVLLMSCTPLNIETQKPQAQFLFQNEHLSIEQRVDDLVAQMTLEEKVAQLFDKAKAIKRLNVHEYNWWNESLHGVARAGTATVFPQAIGLAQPSMKIYY